MFEYRINETLALKMLNVGDAEELFKLTDESRQYLKEWLPWLDSMTSSEDSLNFIKSSLKGYVDNSSLTVAIMYQDEIAGIAGFNLINWNNRIAYIGYWLGEKYQGLGIMTKVSNALVEYAFNQLDLNKVEISAAVENKKSRAIPERLNFTEEGTIRQYEWLYDHYADSVVYGMLKDEWKSRDIK